MDLTEHLTCTGGAELPGGRAGGLPARPHHPAQHGSLPPASPPHLRIAGVRVGALRLGEGRRKVFAAGLIRSSSRSFLI